MPNKHDIQSVNTYELGYLSSFHFKVYVMKFYYELSV